MDQNEEFAALKIRCVEAEKALEACFAAFELIPIDALEKGQNWLPSDIAVHLLKKAKDSVIDYGHAHWNTGDAG